MRYELLFLSQPYENCEFHYAFISIPPFDAISWHSSFLFPLVFFFTMILNFFWFDLYM